MTVGHYKFKELKNDIHHRRWIFVHKSNPSLVEVVIQDTNNNIKGKADFILAVKNTGELDNPYTVNQDFVKSFYEQIKRTQTGLTYSKAGRANVMGDD